jgi:hypothetical protein
MDNSLLDVSGYPFCRTCAGLRQDTGEFISAISGYQIGGTSNMGLEELCNLSQAFIAFAVSIGVIK